MKIGKLSSIKSLASIILCLSMFAPLAHATKSQFHAAPKAKTSYLMVQSAQFADITHDKTDNSYKVILHNVAPFVAFFSERPDRKAGAMHIDEFLNLWEKKGKNSFEANPPNADLHATQIASASEAINFPVELMKPVYNADTKTLSYSVKPLKGANVLPDSAKVQHVLLFIDDVCLTCW